MIDAHVHLWDPAVREQPWMATPSLEPLRRAFDLDDLRDAIAGTRVRATVVVQATSTLDETRELLELASWSGGVIGGVVGWVDLAGSIPEQLADLRAGPGGDRLCGIRHQVEDEPDPDWLLRTEVLAGLREVARAGLPFDLLVRREQLPAAARVARVLPELPMVLDHAGKPPLDGDLAARRAWWQGVAELAQHRQVHCKLSGLGTLTGSVASWEAAREPARHVLALFGARRCMAGSDWPVSTLTAAYGDGGRFTSRLLDGLATAERIEVTRRVARRFYALGG